MSIIEKYKKIVQPIKDKDLQKEYESDWVYLMYNQTNNLYKIGITKDLRGRWRDILNASGCSITMVQALKFQVEYDESASVCEKAIFKIFKHRRIRGEWFDFSIYDLARLNQLFYYIDGEEIKTLDCVYLSDYKNKFIQNGIN
jgi:predicted GIY-YIG superfamily endonuclease